MKHKTEIDIKRCADWHCAKAMDLEMHLIKLDMLGELWLTGRRRQMMASEIRQHREWQHILISLITGDL